MSTGSYSSGASTAYMSGPAVNDCQQQISVTSIASMHQRQQQQQQQQLVNIRHQQLQRQLTSSIMVGRSLSSPSTPDLSDLFQQAVPAGYLLPCPLCDVPLEPRLFRQHLDRHYPRDSPICPVLQCGRRFAHPNSVRNHMRIKHTLQWAKMKAMRSSGGPFHSIPEYK